MAVLFFYKLHIINRLRNLDIEVCLVKIWLKNISFEKYLLKIGWKIMKKLFTLLKIDRKIESYFGNAY